MKILVYILTSFVLGTISERLLPAVVAIGCLIGSVFSPEVQSIISFLSMLFVVLFALFHFPLVIFTAHRINERRAERGVSLSELSRQSCGVKRIGVGLALFLLDTIATLGEQTEPATSVAQLLYDFSYSLAYHWLGNLGFILLVWGVVVFCRRGPATRAPAQDVAALTESPAPTPSKPKARFCKLCGDPIDPVTRKCTGCRKQYFRLPVFTDKHYFIAATAVACAVVVLLLVALVSQRSSYEAQIAELNTQISGLESSLESQDRHAEQLSENLQEKNSELRELRSKNLDLQSEISFYDKYVVFVADDNTDLYHHYDCEAFDSSYFWAYNITAAEDKGYDPCPKCFD